MGYFDFDQPVTKDTTLKMKWCCPALTLTCLTPGTATFYNKWRAKIRINDVELTSSNGSSNVTGSQLHTTTVKAGDKFEFREVDSGAFSKWESSYVASTSTTTGTASMLPVVASTDGATFELDLPDVSIFLAEDGETLPSGGFASFCSNGAITKITDGSFDTSMIKKLGNYNFYYFNRNGGLTSLPSGSFNTDNVRSIGSSVSYVFFSFNSRGALASLPEGSFNFSNVEDSYGQYFCGSFNYYGSIEHLPAGSFRFSTDVKYLTPGFFYMFNSYGSLYDLPAGSFNTEHFIGTYPGMSCQYMFTEFCRDASNFGAIPEGAFRFDNLRYINYSGISDSSTMYFFDKAFGSDLSTGATTPVFKSIPKGSFNFPELEEVYGNQFLSGMFQHNEAIEDIPEGSFSFPKLKRVGNYAFSSMFNYTAYSTAIGRISLPAGSFQFPNLEYVGTYFCNYFNSRGAVEELPAGSFHFGPGLTNAPASFCYHFNSYGGCIKALPEGSFNTENFTTVGNYFLSNFNSELGRIETIPAGAFNFSNITKVGNDFCSSMFSIAANAGSSAYGKYLPTKIIDLPSGSFRFSPDLKQVGDNFLYNFGFAIVNPPAGSFNTENIEVAGSYFMSFPFYIAYSNCWAQLPNHSVVLPEGSFRFDKLRSVGNAAFISFSYDSANLACLTEIVLPEGSLQFPELESAGNTFLGTAFRNSKISQLPDGSFQFPKLKTVGTNAFSNFNYSGGLSSLPAGSFQFPELQSAGTNFFYYFNYSGKNLTSLPANSFQFPSLTADNVSPSNYFYRFNYNGSLTEGNRGVSIQLLHDCSQPNSSADGTVPAGTYLYYNSDENPST